MAGTIIVDRLESDASYASSINVASPMVVSNTINMTGGSITGNVNIDNGTVFVNQNNNLVGFGTLTPETNLDVKGQGHFQLKVTGDSSGYTQGGILINSNTVDNPSGRGLGIYHFNEGLDTTWYTGTFYADGDSWGIGRTSGTTSWDPAAADATTTRLLRVGSTGIVTKPYQPAFKAYHSGTQSVTGGSAANKMSFNTSQFNVGSSYNTSTSRFTAPITGYYLFYAQIYFGTGSDGYWGVNIFINGGQDNAYIYQRGGFGDVSALNTTILRLNSGDYVEVYTYPVSSVTVPNSTANYFTGYLLG